MRRFLKITNFIVLALLLNGVGVAQEESTTETDSSDVDETTEVVADSDDSPEVIEADDDSYLDIEEEDFTPSEEIPTDQSITFPTDI